uniref:Reverse transcriptase domain-containing protein n=1 Tax=Tanacetum cinerariifolium TaxID=118510 RepID=A0A6L2K7B2_TANCI|nr:reverse transcriptase domain-containing protein [Tanacetum cinerariifolium]
MADQRTMAELLPAPTEGYAEAIVVPSILAEQFELKHRAARWWLEKEPPHSIHTWEDLVSKFINEFFPPSRTTNLCNEISNFQQRFDESFHEAWDRYKDLLRACHHHGFTKLHQLDTFYNALNLADQDSLNSAAGGNLLERRTQDVLTFIKNKSKFPFVKAVEEICVTCGGAHPYYQCLAAGGNIFPELKDNIQGYVSATVVNYNQGNAVYRPPGMANQIRPPGFAQPNVQNNQNRFSQPHGYNRGNNFNPEQSYQGPTQQNQVVQLNELEKASLSSQTNEIKNMMASLFQMNTAFTSGSGSLLSNTVANPEGKLKSITTRSGIFLDRPTVLTPPPFINPEVDEHVEETLTDQDLSEYTIKVPPPPEKLQELANTPLNENFLTVILKKLPEKLRDPGKFLIPCGFNELKSKSLADLGDVFVSVGKFTFPVNFVIVDYESDPRVHLILGRPFLRTARVLIDVYGEEMVLCDGDERLILNMRHDTSSYSKQPQKESINLINVFNNSSEDFLEDLFSTNQPTKNPTFSSHIELTSPKVKDDIFDPKGGNVLPEKLLDLYSTKDLHPTLHINPLSSSTIYSSSTNQLLEELADELAFITFPPKYDDDLYNIANLADNFVDSIPEMLTDEHALDYSFPPIFDEYDDDLFEVVSNTENVYDDPLDSKGEKIKESKLLIDELDLPWDSLPSFEYDSFPSEDFSRVYAKPSTNNKDKVFNPGIFIQENPFEIITRVAKDKKLATSNASLVIEDFDPPLYELPFVKEVPRSKMLLPFSSENKKKVFKPGIHTS